MTLNKLASGFICGSLLLLFSRDEASVFEKTTKNSFWVRNLRHHPPHSGVLP